MDMAVANLFKHKIRLILNSEVTKRYEPEAYKRGRYYFFLNIENVESVDASLFKPFVLYAISKVVHEDRDIQIDSVTIVAGITDLKEYEEYALASYRFESPQYSPELFFTHAEVDTRPFPEHLLNEPFHVWVNVISYFFSDKLREALFRQALNYENRDEENMDDESTDEEEDTPAPLIETHKQERCVICLEAEPNILYLDCGHIAVCDSCDRMKRTARSRKKCDLCRSRISKRIKI